MRTLLVILIALTISYESSGWGQTGHRVIGMIAEYHLSKKAKKNIRNILQGQSVAMVSNYMDEIKSDNKYDNLIPWHYCTIPDGKTYEEAGTPDEGDIIYALELFIEELETKNFNIEDEAFALKCLIHLMGDIHQPLHVGNGEDRGGNDTEVEYFWRKSNLHRIWDTGIIDGQNLSYTEYTNWILHVDEQKIETWSQSGILDWAYESMSYRDQVYDLPDDHKISYQYNYKNIDLVNLRLLQAGIRLAKILNDIYG
jgi:hypothetical protein